MVVKICGITTLEDALTALAAGAGWLGFNFYSHSPRYLSPEACRSLVEVIRPLYPEATLVGVFVNAPADEVWRILDECRLDLAQLSGDEPPEVLRHLGQRASRLIALAHRMRWRHFFLPIRSVQIPRLVWWMRQSPVSMVGVGKWPIGQLRLGRPNVPDLIGGWFNPRERGHGH